VSLSELDEIISRLRYVQSGDIIEASDHNNIVDAIKKIREILGTVGVGVSPCIALVTPLADYYIKNGLISIDDAVKCIKDYWNLGTWTSVFDAYLSVESASAILNSPELDPRYATDILLSHRLDIEKALRIAYNLKRTIGLGAYINWSDTTPYYWWDTPDVYHAIEIDRPEPGYKRVYKASGGSRYDYDILFKVVPDTLFGTCPDDPNYARMIYVGEIGAYCGYGAHYATWETVITKETATTMIPTDTYINFYNYMDILGFENGSYKNRVAMIIEVDIRGNNAIAKLLKPDGSIIDMRQWNRYPRDIPGKTVSIFIGTYIEVAGYEQWASINRDFQVIIRYW